MTEENKAGTPADPSAPHCPTCPKVLLCDHNYMTLYCKQCKRKLYFVQSEDSDILLPCHETPWSSPLTKVLAVLGPVCSLCVMWRSPRGEEARLSLRIKINRKP